MGAAVERTLTDLLYRVPVGGSVIYTDELGNELFRVSSVSDAVKVSGTTLDPTALATPVAGVATGYKVARGVHTQAAASDTVVTGLATVVACVAQFQSAPTVKQLLCAASVGNQSSAPAAGSILIKTYKPTAVNDVTPTPATDFSENLVLGWIAVGT